MGKNAPASRTLAGAFLAALPESARASRAVGHERLEDELRAAVDTFRTAYPDVALDDAACATSLAEAALGEHGHAAAIDALRTTDVLLARACALGEPHALAIFERDYLGPVGDFIAHVDRSSWFVDEVKQHLREKLLVGADGAAPRIAEYGGSGALGGWVRVAAVRLALNLKRTEKRRGDVGEEARAGDDALAGAGATDAEVPHLKRLLADDFRRALEQTLKALPRDERVVLRMHYLDGLSIDELAPLYRVHRATIARWIERARKRILDETRRRLRDRLGAGAARDIDSVVRLVRSELDVSLARFLRTTAAEAKK